MMEETPYQGYTYSYPHKTAYRPLDPPIALRDAWAGEPRGNLFLYLHIPFCEMRCGFCNLFTTANPEHDLTADYIAALKRQAHVVKLALGDHAQFARMAIGGGTPTYLDAHALEGLFDLVETEFGFSAAAIPVSVETSPRTAELDRLQVLRDRGVTRISMGVQSFVESEMNGLGRAQKNQWVAKAIERIRALGFPTMNLDLIYGASDQTLESWAVSLQEALRFQPEELYLYPLYVRPLTGLDRRGVESSELRLACYRLARDLLLSNGYDQLSMRMFRRSDAPDAEEGPVYCCQEDGMVGVGCGARSYTSTLHYSSEYAVGAGGVRAILDRYNHCSNEQFAVADYGIRLSDEELRRRWVVKSLLRRDGLDRRLYRERFQCDPVEEFPELLQLAAEELLEFSPDVVRLTAAGMEQSDSIGPRFYSSSVQDLMREYSFR